MIQQNDITRRGALRLGGATILGAVGLGAVGVVACSDEPGTEPEPTGPASKGREAPMLAARVEAGQLPPVEERLPENPLVVEPVDRIGVYGGEWRSVFLGPSDTGWVNREIGYDQLIHWDPEFVEPIPNLAESFEAEDEGRSYTITLRSGLKWSDGEAFTTDDIVFAYEDVYSEPNLLGIPVWLRSSDGEPATLEQVDEVTVRFVFNEPQGLLLPNLATSRAEELSRFPRHYLEQFHQKYNDQIDALVQEEGVDDWIALFASKATDGFWNNTELPRMTAWVLTTGLDAGTRIVAERNPYYFKVDSEGSQLPYIDRVSYQLVEDKEVMLLRGANGEIDLYTRYTEPPTDKPVLAQTREEGQYDFFDIIWSATNYTHIYLNLTHKDPQLREVFENKDFRIGLSHAINRQEIIDAVFQQQGEPFQVAVAPESEFYDEEFATQFTEYDVDLANEHLDQAGYTERDGDGFRLRPDGERISFTIEIATGIFDYMPDAMDLVRGYWREVGVDLSLSVVDRGLFGERVEANNHDAATWGGGDSYRWEAILNPRVYMPFNSESRFGIPWANWFTGTSEPQEEPPAPAQEQIDLYRQLAATVDDEEKTEIFREILRIAKEQFYVMGTVLPRGTFGFVRNRFHNVPASMPGSFIYPTPGPALPEHFFIEEVGGE